MGKTFETTINIGGNIDPSVRAAIEKASAAVGNMTDEMLATASAAAKFTSSMDKQEAAIRAAQEQYASYVLAGEKGSKQAKELAKTIQAMDREFAQNKKTLKAAEDAANELAPSLDDVGDSASDTKGGFSVMKGAMANLVSQGITALISKCAEAVKSVYGLAESTREYREDMGKLETAFEAAGQSTDLATETYKNFYSVLGEEDRSVEAVNHLAKFVSTEEDMAKWTDIATGVWGTFGDSLPIEGLTEAANETAKVGKVTGVLADALNWAGVSEDDFQASLDALNSEQERSAYITETLSGLYSGAADAYQENNASIIEARKVQSDYNDTMAGLGEAMEPITTAVQGGLNKLLKKALEFVEKVDIAGFAEQIGVAFEMIVPVLDQVLTEAMPFVEEFLAGIIDALPVILPLFMTMVETLLPPLFEIIQMLMPSLFDIVEAIMPVLADVLDGLMPMFIKIVNAILPVVVKLIDNLLPLVYPLLDVLLMLLEDVVFPLMEPLLQVVEALLPAIGPLLEIILHNMQPVFDLLSLLAPVLGEIIGFIAKVVGWVSDGLNWVVDLIFGDSSGDIAAAAEIEGYATGGFTNGLSFAGEDGTEAVISFNPAYRAQNIGYWAQAGRMLGADIDDFALGGSYGGETIDFGGVSFAPQIVVQGNASKADILAALDEAEDDFMDRLEEMIMRRKEPAYA